MRVEFPEFKRCCCCLPLRYGLLGWGYIKLILCMYLLYSSLLYILQFTKLLTEMFLPLKSYLPQLMAMVGVTTLLIVDFGMIIVFLIGGHKKNVKILKIFYMYSIVALCLLTILSCIKTGFYLYNVIYAYALHETYRNELSNITFSFRVVAEIISLFTKLGMDTYVILLVKSEIKKLSNDCKFRFTKAENEAQCSMENGKIESVNETGDLNNGTEDAEIRIYDQNNEIND